MCHTVPAGSSQDQALLQPASRQARNQERAVGVYAEFQETTLEPDA